MMSISWFTKSTPLWSRRIVLVDTMERFVSCLSLKAMSRMMKESIPATGTVLIAAEPIYTSITQSNEVFCGREHAAVGWQAS
jgi:hypothetical protein